MDQARLLTNSIYDFMFVCNFKGLFTGSNDDKIAAKNAIEFIANLSEVEPTTQIFENILINIRPLPPELVNAMIPLGRAGAHGQLFSTTIPLYRNYVWKRIVVNSAEPIYAFNVIREAFIQNTLATFDCAPDINEIFSYTDKGVDYIYILMERESHELFEQYSAEININRQLFGRQPLLFFQNSGYLLLQILNKLKMLWENLRFVHRDLKHDNIMLRPVYQNGQIVNYKLHFIDFGFSCITLNVNDRDYVIRASRVYAPTTPCDFRQDILSLFANLAEPTLGPASIYHNMDHYGREAIDGVIPKPFRYNSNIVRPRQINIMRKRARNGTLLETRRRLPFYATMYNRNGSLLNTARRTRRSNNASNTKTVAEHLEHDNIIKIINDKFAESISNLPGEDIQVRAGYAIDNMIQIAKYATNKTNSVNLIYPPPPVNPTSSQTRAAPLMPAPSYLSETEVQRHEPALNNNASLLQGKTKLRRLNTNP